MLIPRALFAGNAAAVTWSPWALGTSLFAWFDAEIDASVTQSGGLVSAWQDVVSSFSVIQSNGSQKPVYTTGSFNSRPGIIFDGVDDRLQGANFPASYPSGGAPGWIWGLVSQEAGAGVVSRCDVLSYGSQTTTNNTRRLCRVTTGGVNRAVSGIGDGTNNADALNTSVDFSNRHVVIAKASGTISVCDVDGVSGSAGQQSAVPATTASQLFSIGGATNGGDFWTGRMSAVLLTAPLSAADEAKLLAHLSLRL